VLSVKVYFGFLTGNGPYLSLKPSWDAPGMSGAEGSPRPSSSDRAEPASSTSGGPDRELCCCLPAAVSTWE